MTPNACDRVKGSWSLQEGASLRKLVEEHGPRNWSLISSGIPGRSGKSCRLRWCNQLGPTEQHHPFTPTEDALIVEAHRVHGNKWTTIARLLPGWPDNVIKNHWNSTLHRRRLPELSSVSSGSDPVVKRALSYDNDKNLAESALKRPCLAAMQQGVGRGFDTGTNGIRTFLTLSRGPCTEHQQRRRRDQTVGEHGDMQQSDGWSLPGDGDEEVDRGRGEEVHGRNVELRKGGSFYWV